jgi:hypothetical protein
VLSSSIPQYGKSVYLAQISPQLFELPLKWQCDYLLIGGSHWLIMLISYDMVIRPCYN